jgi:hypothetical protein
VQNGHHLSSAAKVRLKIGMIHARHSESHFDIYRDKENKNGFGETKLKSRFRLGLSFPQERHLKMHFWEKIKSFSYSNINPLSIPFPYKIILFT